MTTDYPVSDTGVWIDTKSGALVYSEPEEGQQLAAPGTEVTPDTQARIDAHRDAEKATAEGADETGVAPVSETATAPVSETATSRRRR